MDREPGRAMVLVSVAYLVGLLALWAWLGYLADSAWVGITGLVSLFLVHYAYSRASSKEFTSAFVWSWLGALGLASAATLAEWAGQWIWAVPWAISALIFVGIGLEGQGKAQTTSWMAYLLAAWSIVLAFTGPLWLFGKTQEEVQAQTLDLLGRWWWVALIALVGLVVVVTLASVAVDALRNRRRRPNPRPTPRPAAPRPSLGSPFDNAIFGGGEPAGPAPRPGRPAAPDRPFLRIREEDDVEPAPPPRPPVRTRVPETSKAAPKPIASAADAGILVSDPDLGKARPGGATVPAPGATVLASAHEQTQPGPDSGATVLVANRGQRVVQTLYRVDAELCDLVVHGADHIVLAADGRLLHWTGDRLEPMPGLTRGRSRPVGLSAGGDVVVAAGEGGELVAVDVGAGGMRETGRHSAGSRIRAFALNPYGTMVAFATPWLSHTGPFEPATVRAMVLASGEVQPLIVDDGQRMTMAMAFSPDGRRLALGAEDGVISLLDMATRQLVARLAPAKQLGPVVALTATPEGGWVAGHAEPVVARWDASGSMVGEATEAAAITTLAVAPSSGRIAVGRSDGHVTMYPAQLTGPGEDRVVSDGRIVRVVFEAGGGALLCAVEDGAVQRLTV